MNKNVFKVNFTFSFKIGDKMETQQKIEGFVKVKPIIIYPPCLKAGKKQDCYNCKISKCPSPRGWCVRFYHGHPKGCPNYGKYGLCPPNAPMFDEIFDMNKDIYLIYIAYDLGAHMDKMKKRHPNWSERQLRNVLYWQPAAKKMHRDKIKDFLDKYAYLGFEVSTPEALGVDVTKTLGEIGIYLDWPPQKYTYRIAFAGIPSPGKSIKKWEENKHNKLTNIN